MAATLRRRTTTRSAALARDFNATLARPDIKEKLLAGDRVGYAKTALDNACKGLGTDETKIKAVLNGLAEADRQRLVTENPGLRSTLASSRLTTA